jgi:hypothetical protein
LFFQGGSDCFAIIANRNVGSTPIAFPESDLPKIRLGISF